MVIRNEIGPLSEERLPIERRREAFQALVELQDSDVPVAQSRKIIAERFGLSDAEVWQVEREGLDNNWPPL
jgi:hypothetical protein